MEGKIGKGDPETLTENDEKKVMRAFPRHSETDGGQPLKLVNSIFQGAFIDIRHSTACHKGTVADLRRTWQWVGHADDQIMGVNI